jgi:hypothetical protein
MNYARPIDFAGLMETVAAVLLGERNASLSKPPRDVRYGNRGSLSVDFTAGRFFDHENNCGGGVVDLVKWKLDCDHGAAVDWLRREGYIPNARPQQPPPKPSPFKVVETKPSISATYDYVDKGGALLFQVVRFEPKEFRQRRPNGKDDWIWGLDGVRRVLYRLPELLGAIAAGKTIYIVEGEKDADALRTFGFPATTNPMGANKWRPEYSEFLRGADVVIVPDNDQTGRAHAEHVAASLNGIAKRVRVLDIGKVWQECPQKGDISDWLEAFGMGDEPPFLKLAAMVEALPDWKPPAADRDWRQKVFDAATLQTMTFPPLKFILPGFIPEGATLLVSRPKLGKSWLVLDLAIATAAERFTLGELKPSPGNVLYLALEDGPRRLQRRMTKLLPTFSGQWPAQLHIVTEWRRANQGGLADIESWIKSVPTPRLVIIDTLAQFRKVSNGKNQAYADDYAAISDLRKLGSKYNIGIVIVHHDRKAEADDVFDTVSGTLGLSASADTVLIMKKHAGAVNLYVRGRDIEESETALQFDKAACRWSVLGAAAEVFRSAERGRVIAALREAGLPLQAKEIWAAAELKNRNATDLLLSKMVQKGEVVRVGKAQYALPPEDGGQIGQTDRWTDRRPAQTVEDNTDIGDLSDLSDLSDDLSKTPTDAANGNGAADRRCDHCGRVGATGLWERPGRPGGIWLHSRCEEPWWDSEVPVSR